MARRTNGVLKYVKATLEVAFPEGEVYCAYCPAYQRNRCLQLGLPMSPDYAWMGVLPGCPLKFEEENDGKIQTTDPC